MKRARGLLFLSSVAVGVALLAPLAPPYAPSLAAGAAGAKPAGPVPSAPLEAPQVASLTAMLEGFKWGTSHTDIATNFTKLGGVIDKDYDPLLRKVQPGVQMTALEADRDNKKAAIDRSWLKFDFPTGYDGTGLRTEYSYKNNESCLLVERMGKKRYFFFMGQSPGERLWKIYDEIPLNESGSLGKTYQEAVTRLQNALGVAGRVRAADAANGIAFTTVDWQDGTTHLRALDRREQVGVVLEERATLNALAQLRSHKEEDLMAIDPSIAAVTRGTISDPSKSAPAGSASAKPPPGGKKK